MEGSLVRAYRRDLYSVADLFSDGYGLMPTTGLRRAASS